MCIRDSPRGFGTTLASVKYDSLPNPIYDLLRRLPVVDGLDLDQLVKFFEGIFGIYDFPGVTGASLLNMIYPYCRAPLLDRVVWHLGAGGDFDAFHRDVLELFMPGRLRDQMRQRLFYRVQGHGKKLNVFINSIKSAARVLRVDVSEAEVVRVILEGLNPQERSRLVFLERPRSFADLSRACVFARTIQMNDETRSGTSEFPVPCSTSGQQRPPNREQRGDNSERKNYSCYTCGKMGHLARNCHFKRSEVSRENRPSKNVPSGGGLRLSLIHIYGRPRED